MQLGIDGKGCSEARPANGIRPFTKSWPCSALRRNSVLLKLGERDAR